ncbi:outer membrane protein RomA [Legionella santicrucis]|uniref:Outer membrane protein RomA n=1 Tax=Legionella santicrucis TaxID=45074 RepID=A0A0W0YIA4_9GAMM|nr:MBL fold metallo-hydrolase [Legionella santicrucis]KTD56567.1 outer membrane protein RomA [Legionella santicrucis]
MSKHKIPPAYPISNHYNGTHFFNPGIRVKKRMKDVFQMLKERKDKNAWPDFIENKATPVLAPKHTTDRAYITYVNHASHLIQLQNINVLTDPIFSTRAGPFSLLGPKRVRKPGIALKELPHIDIVLISHNHYDHMDLPSLKKLERRFNPLFIVPLGNQKYLKVKKIIELDWWQTHLFHPEQTITLVPAQHWSKRTLNDTNTALWGGFWIQFGTIKIYFSGDSGYGDHFKLIYEKLGAPNISILPIGAYEPRWFMKEQHMNPKEAVLASIDLNSQFSLANHHQTFRLSLEHIDDPFIDLQHSILTHGLKEKAFIAPETGETVIFCESNQTLTRSY